MAQVHLIPNDQVSAAQRRALLPLAEEQRSELDGLIGPWISRTSPALRIFVVVASETERPVGLVCWSGPLNAVTPSWWIGIKQQGYGRAAVRELAHELVKAGVRGIGDIVIDGVSEEFMAASKKLAQELLAEFDRIVAYRS